ncbi:MAG: 2-phospho-L-lactate guanylyltransferase [Deltaproteobacteria bacterium]|nr:MAG: 2-phospho-L-lactate guanylyltransferase [Deltaproteobacteria bacterium]
MIAALVPVKRLELGKSRLRARLAREDVERLSLAMLGDVLAALLAVRALDPVAVVTEDPLVARAAEAAGARAIEIADDGLNPSLERAARVIQDRALDGLLVVLGDVAGACANDLRTLLDTLGELGGRGVVLAPSLDGGTSALLRAPPDVIPAAFGPDSAARHRELAEAAGVPYRERVLPSLAIDIDLPDDLARFARAPGDGVRTAALLRELGVRSDAR